MTTQDYLAQLAAELARLPQAERDEAMEFYIEYLDDAEDAGAAMAKLGTPKEVARSILADRAIQSIGAKPETTGVRQGVSALWVVALALSPVALVLALAFIIVVLALLMAVVIFTVALLGGGGWLLWHSFFAMSIDLLSGLFFAGVALILLGLAVLMVSVIWRAGGAVLRWAAIRLNRRRNRRVQA